MTNVDLNALSVEEKKELRRQMEAEIKAEKEKRQQDRDTYKELVSQTVGGVFERLKETAKSLQESKQNVYRDFEKVLELKAEVYGVKEAQQSHTFTSEDGRESITIGFRTIDCYDDTMHSGVAKIKQYIASLAVDEASGKLVEVINNLLRMDKNGNLKPSRVLELKKLSTKIDNKDFAEGLEIIEQSYKPKASATFVSAWETDKDRVKHYLPLSMTSCE